MNPLFIRWVASEWSFKQRLQTEIATEIGKSSAHVHQLLRQFYRDKTGEDYPFQAGGLDRSTFRELLGRAEPIPPPEAFPSADHKERDRIAADALAMARAGSRIVDIARFFGTYHENARAILQRARKNERRALARERSAIERERLEALPPPSQPKGRPIDMGGSRDVWLEFRPGPDPRFDFMEPVLP